MIFFRDKTPPYRKTGAWARCSTGIEGPCRISLARNLSGEKFNAWATSREKDAIREKILNALKKADADMDTVFPQDIAPAGRKYSFIPFKGSNAYATLEEADHLRLEIFCAPDGDTEAQTAWQELRRIDMLLEEHLDWAWTVDLGYMTADHMSLGTGLHMTGVFHFVGLKMFNDVSAVLNALERLRFQVEFCGKEAEAGEFPVYRVTNAQTLGMDESAIIARTERIFKALREHEARARYSLMKEHPLRAMQHVSAALSKLKNSFLLTDRDALILLTALNFGVNMGLVRGISASDLQTLLTATQSAMPSEGDPGAADDLDLFNSERAELIHKKLRNVQFSDNIAAEWGLIDGV